MYSFFSDLETITLSFPITLNITLSRYIIDIVGVYVRDRRKGLRPRKAA